MLKYSSRIDINSVAHKIYKDIHSKPYTEQTGRDLTRDRPYRRIHGFTSSCRAAAFIRIFLDIAEKNRSKLPGNIQASLDEFLKDKENNIILLQVIALLRIAGRTIDTDSGKFFAERGKVVAGEYLTTHLGWPKEAAEDWAKAIHECDPMNPLSKNNVTDIRTILLGDAATLDTFRDTHAKTVTPGYFFLSLLSKGDEGIHEDLKQVVQKARELICRQQKFCYVTYTEGAQDILYYDGTSLHSKENIYQAPIPKTATDYDKRELLEDCFSLMEAEVQTDCGIAHKVEAARAVKKRDHDEDPSRTVLSANRADLKVNKVDGAASSKESDTPKVSFLKRIIQAILSFFRRLFFGVKKIKTIERNTSNPKVRAENLHTSDLTTPGSPTPKKTYQQQIKIFPRVYNYPISLLPRLSTVRYCCQKKV